MNKFLDLMVFVEDQKWLIDEDNAIRNEKGQCPICALVEVLTNGAIQDTIWAGCAWSAFVNGDTMTEEEELLFQFTRAADSPQHPDRKELEEALHANQ